MEQYISKSALVAEIEKIIPQRAYERETLHSEFVRGQRVAYNEVLSLIDTLEVKSAYLDVMQRMKECPYRNVGCDIGTIDVGGVTVDKAEFNKKVKELIHGKKSEHKEQGLKISKHVEIIPDDSIEPEEPTVYLVYDRYDDKFIETFEKPYISEHDSLYKIPGTNKMIRQSDRLTFFVR